MTPLAKPEQVLALLRGPHTVMEVAQRTGWPVTTVRRLANQQPGWLLGVDGRARMPGKPREPALEVNLEHEPRPAPELHAELEARRRHAQRTWDHVATQIGVSTETLRLMAKGHATPHTRARVQAWLAVTPPPQDNGEVRSPEQLHTELLAHKQDLGLTWQRLAMRLHTNVQTLQKMRHGALSPLMRKQVESWLDKTAHTPDKAAVS